jgi:triacylglycerol esterase/lipase EstA (alpha/beta hydrolase family)
VVVSFIGSISAIFRTRTSSTIYKIPIEKRERWANRGMAFVCHWKYMDFGEDNKKCLLAFILYVMNIH